MMWIFWALCLLLPVEGFVRTRNPPCSLKNTRKPFKVLTFDAALLDTVFTDVKIPNNREPRCRDLIRYLKTSDADIVCLQKVYIGDDIEAIVDTLSVEYPYSHSELHLYNGQLPLQDSGLRAPVCDMVATTNFSTCLTTAGCNIDIVDQKLEECINTNCKPEFQNVTITGGAKCLSCLFSADKTNRMTKCTSAAPAIGLWDMSTLGLLLLSKKPLADPLVVPFYQSAMQPFQKGYLQATVNGDFTAACAHLSNDVFTFETKLNKFFLDADAQNDFEIQNIIGRLKDEKPLLLMGNFHVGPNIPNILPVKEEHYDRLAAEFNTVPASECTVCDSNPYNAGSIRNVNVVVNHIFGNGILKITEPMVVLKTDDASVVTDGKLLPISDHFGVEATVTCGFYLRRSKYNRSQSKKHMMYKKSRKYMQKRH